MTSDEIRAAIDRLKAIPCDDTPGVYDVTGAFMDMDMYGSYSAIGLRNRLIGLLEQADPDTHMELPKDADGVPWRIGDTTEGISGELLTVETFAPDSLACTDKYGCSHTIMPPSAYRHYRKPTFEDVVRDMLNDVVCTFESSGGCSAWMSDTKVADYADRLREVMADE